MCMCVVLTRFLDSQTGFLDPLSHTHRRTPPTQKMYELICAKMSIFPSKMAQETIQYGQEMSQDAQETCHLVQETCLGVQETGY